jgi:uncharacterized repeat protein (TIGR03803 family)
MQENQINTRQPRGWKSVLAAVLFCAVAMQAQTYTSLADFSASVGAGPSSPPIQGLDGKLYGTALTGGPKTYGTFYSATTSGTLADFFTFCKSPSCLTGQYPYLSLLQTADGSFYGYTHGGSNYGTILKVLPNGAAKTLFTFGCGVNCGVTPAATLIQARDGNLYGTTGFGGSSTSNAGIVFKLTSNGTVTTLHDFCQLANCTDGSYPLRTLLQATDGNLYGTTRTGGSHNDGTIYQLSLNGTFKTIYKFSPGLVPMAQIPSASSRVSMAIFMA